MLIDGITITLGAEQFRANWTDDLHLIFVTIVLDRGDHVGPPRGLAFAAGFFRLITGCSVKGRIGFFLRVEPYRLIIVAVSCLGTCLLRSRSVLEVLQACKGSGRPVIRKGNQADVLFVFPSLQLSDPSTLSFGFPTAGSSKVIP